MAWGRRFVVFCSAERDVSSPIALNWPDRAPATEASVSGTSRRFRRLTPGRLPPVSRANRGLQYRARPGAPHDRPPDPDPP